jgi:hypothetical protein
MENGEDETVTLEIQYNIHEAEGEGIPPVISNL